MFTYTSRPITVDQIRAQFAVIGFLVAVWIGVTVPFVVDAIAG